MAKLTLATIANILIDTVSAALNINNNNAAISAAMENTLSRDGTSPNQMEADLDLNGHALLNATTMTIDTIAVTSGITINGEPVIPGAGGGGPGSDTVTSVAGRTGDVVLTKNDVGLSSVDNTSDSNKPVSTAQATADSLRLLKTSNLSDLSSPTTALSNLGGSTTGIALFVASDASAARTAISAAGTVSPTLTGTPTAPTASPGTNTTQLSTTAFVTAAINALSSIYQPIAAYLTSLVGVGSNGFVVKTGSTAAARTLQSGPSLVLTNPAGAAGDPSITLNAASTTADPVNNEDIAFKRISDTSLRVSMRGSDGVVRSFDITVA